MVKRAGAEAGLDFGTTTTLVASSVGIVQLGSADVYMPSIVGYDRNGLVVVGEDAAMAPSEHVVRSIKRCITLGQDRVRVDTPQGMRDVPADDLMAAILTQAVRRSAASSLDLTRSGSVVVGCPAMWDGHQRTRLLSVAERAGIQLGLAEPH